MKAAPISCLLAVVLALGALPRVRAADATDPAAAPPAPPAPAAAAATAVPAGTPAPEAATATPETATRANPATPPTAAERTVPDPMEVSADALIVRPVGVAATVVGAAIYVVALPFAAIAGDIHTPAKSLVGAPAHFTFKRRLGDFGSGAR